MSKNKRIRLGMVGGGQGAFIGAIHRLAARMDDHFELVAGALSADPARATLSAVEIGLPVARSYSDFAEMANREASLDNGIEAVAIVTPNHLHFPVAKAFLKAGIHVICDKPLVMNSQEALELLELVNKTNLLFAVTYNYSGYPMVRQARAMISAGVLGQLRLVQMEYSQGWLSTDIETDGHKQAEWRTDPARAGVGGCIGDIGTHAYHLACFISGLKLHSLAADLSLFIPGRRLDDNANVMLRFKGGARGHLWASQVAVGNENGLRFRIFGDKGGLDWHQERPDHLWHAPIGEPKRLLVRGGAGILPEIEALSRVPAGHPEGYLEGFATLYSDIAQEIYNRHQGKASASNLNFPTIADGADGVAFVEATVKSARQDSGWVRLE